MTRLALLLVVSSAVPLASAQDAPGGPFRPRPNGDACHTVACWNRALHSEPPDDSSYYEAALLERRRGRLALADSLLALAVDGVPTDAQRARFYAALASKGYGRKAEHLAACLGYDPLNGTCLFLQAGLDGDAARQSAGESAAGRAVYWCMADRYENVAAASTGQTAVASRRAAAQYARAAPSSRESLDSGWTIGQVLNVPGGACVTRVRLNDERDRGRR